jgi:hypothetical protein
MKTEAKTKLVLFKMGWGPFALLPPVQGAKLVELLAYAQAVDRKGFGKYQRYAPSQEQFDVSLIDSNKVVTTEEDQRMEQEYQAEKEREKAAKAEA